MPSYAAFGLIGVGVALGYLIWTVWNQTPPNPNKYHHDTPPYSPGPGYDRPHDTWENGDESSRRRKQQKTSQCAICHESMDLCPKKILPCNHVFHAKCINEWFQQSRTCPNCRHPA